MKWRPLRSYSLKAGGKLVVILLDASTLSLRRPIVRNRLARIGETEANVIAQIHRQQQCRKLLKRTCRLRILRIYRGLKRPSRAGFREVL